ncbi:MAG: hypothetical protein H7Z72_21150 [Bacteroidetes bacterium]|nr:hypothetical protein [Fibrella sp.]
MKHSLLILMVLLTGCSGGNSKKAMPTGAATITFNGFAMGTPLDTLAQQAGGKPAQQTEDQLYYTDVTLEGVRWKNVTYDFVGGKLARVTAIQPGRDLADYRKLYQAFTSQYGKPTRDIDSLTIWARRDAELSLQPGNILFSRR